MSEKKIDHMETAARLFADNRSGVEGLGDALKAQAKVEVQELFSGLSRMATEIGTELKHQTVFGAHEAAAALFRGDAFVLYPKNGNEGSEQENQGHGLHGPAIEQPEVERGGRE
jgi:hypothetical protein